MKSMKEIADINSNIITEAAMYDDMIAMLNECKENGTPIDEGLMKSIFGGITGAVAGPAIGKAFCKALGIDERGMLGNMLTSRMFLTALGGYMGWKN